VPGTSSRYAQFVIEAAPLPYDAKTTAPMGCLPGDFNEDGLIDIIVYYWGRTPVAFLRRGPSTGDGAVLNAGSYRRFEIAPKIERWYTNAATSADLDGDGHLDLVIGNYFQDEARILDMHGDGTEQMQDSMSRAFNGGRNRLLRWRGASSGDEPEVWFEEHAGVFSKEIEHAWTLAIGTADLDGDLLPEIYFANDFGPDRLLHNRSTPGEFRFYAVTGQKGLTTPSSKVVGRDSFKGMGVDFGDLNGDGLLDIYVSNIASEFALEESHFAFLSTGAVDAFKQGAAPYVDHSEALGLSRSGWSWDSRLGDFNNDGVLEAMQATGFMKGEVNRWADLHEVAMGNDTLLSNPKSWHRFRPGDDLDGNRHVPFYVRASDGRFYDLAREVGIAQMQISRGIATADTDGDGRLDFAVANQWEASTFYRNLSPASSAFLGLHLRIALEGDNSAGPATHQGHPAAGRRGRPAVGAQARVLLPDGRQLVAQVDGGNGHSGKRSPDLHFGLGPVSSDARLRVEIRWRDSQGRVRTENLSFSPGWHTVWLGHQPQGGNIHER
jgi:hypothetical protein